MNAPVFDPPANLDAEQALLGSILEIGGESLVRLGGLEPDDFHVDQHRLIFTSMQNMVDHGEPLDLLTVTEELRRRGHLEAAGGPAKLAFLVTVAGLPSHVQAYARLVIDARLKRDVLRATLLLADKACNGTRPADLSQQLRDLAERVDQRAGGKNTERFTVYDAADEWESAAQEFIVQDLLPLVGVIWCGGRPKGFKSLFILYVCLAIATGRPIVANRFQVLRRPRIVFVSREDGDSRLADRSKDILTPWGVRPQRGTLLFLIRPQFDLMNAADVQWLRDLCRRQGITLVVLDTWTALSPAEDPLGPKDQAALAAVVVQLAADIGGTVVVLDHSRKNRPEGANLSSAEIFGPPQKWAAAESLIMLGSTDDPRRIEVFIEGKDTETSRFFLTVSPRGNGEEKFSYAGSVEQLADDQRAVGDANRQAVLDILLTNSEALSAGELVATLEAGARKLSADTVQRHLAALIKAGRVRRIGKGKATRYFGLAVSTAEPSAANAGVGE